METRSVFEPDSYRLRYRKDFVHHESSQLRFVEHSIHRTCVGVARVGAQAESYTDASSRDVSDSRSAATPNPGDCAPQRKDRNLNMLAILRFLAIVSGSLSALAWMGSKMAKDGVEAQMWIGVSAASLAGLLAVLAVAGLWKLL